MSSPDHELSPQIRLWALLRHTAVTLSSLSTTMGEWKEAGHPTDGLVNEGEEPRGFTRMMLLVANLKGDRERLESSEILEQVPELINECKAAMRQVLEEHAPDSLKSFDEATSQVILRGLADSFIRTQIHNALRAPTQDGAPAEA